MLSHSPRQLETPTLDAGALAFGGDAKRCRIAAMEEALPKARASKWELRVPKLPPRQLVVRAKGEKVSLNTLAVTSLAEGLGEWLAHAD
jgi:predicted HicB family RNase H-like nuclease